MLKHKVLHDPNHELNLAAIELGRVLGPLDYVTSAWSGGSTTELACYPFDADFSQQQFLWRVSIATVAKDGTFTRFENTRRNLMVLKGGIQLIHEGEHECSLLPFKQDKFSGRFRTSAKMLEGGATNLNLMLKDGSDGDMLHIALESGLSHHYALVHQVTDSDTPSSFSKAVDLLYNVDGEILIRHSSTKQEIHLRPGESFFISRNSSGRNGEVVIHNSGDTLANIVAVRILHV